MSALNTYAVAFDRWLMEQRIKLAAASLTGLRANLTPDARQLSNDLVGQMAAADAQAAMVALGLTEPDE